MHAELSANSQAQPYAGISEFELPGRTRDLAVCIIRELVNPCRQQLASADVEFRKAKEGRLAKLNGTRSQVKQLLAESQRIFLAAKNHLQSQKLSLNSATAAVDATTTPPCKSIASAEKDLETLNGRLAILCAKKLPPFWPNNAAARWTIVIITLILWAIVPLHGFILLLYPVLVLAVKLFLAKSIKSDYRHIDQSIQRLRPEIQALELAPHKEYETEEQEAIELHRKKMIAFGATLHERAQSLHAEADKLWKESVYAGADWDSPIWQQWSPDPSPEFAARIGTFVIKADEMNHAFPNINFAFKLPALIPFAKGRCLLVDASGNARNAAEAAFLSVMVRVLANTPPGKARFTLIDPVGLGQHVADFMHLADHNKELISGKAWSEPQHIEQQLTLLTEHMETVIQGCLRNEFASIRDYNRERHEVAQPFRFLVVNDFPVNFTEASARRLLTIVKNGPRCGVYTFISRDTSKPPPYKFDVGDLTASATQIQFLGDTFSYENQTGGFGWSGKEFEGFVLLLDKLPPQDLTTKIVKISGELAVPAMKIDVPFAKLLANASLLKESWWSASAAKDLQVPLGPAGARAIQGLSLGGDQEPHALLVGRTGSGKTNLMHVMITGIALKYSPQEVQLYLIDFKGGVGFKRYAECRLPHAKVIAIESEREFGMSVLRDLDAELARRSNTFRAANVDNLAAYRTKMESEKTNGRGLPRILLVVDEFQEFFMENDDLAQQAKIILERLARQGRGYGIHFLLATQSLAGSAQLPTAIMGQIKVRIALPCSEADSRLILADDNKAARSLSQPGEAIYNSMGGLIEGNNRFQVARFSDNDLSTYLTAVSGMVRDGYAPLIFEGNELANIADCALLKGLLHAPQWPQPSKGVDIFLGEPIAIAPPVAARLRRQSGAHLMILSRDEAEGVGMCLAALLNIVAQQPPNGRRIFIMDFATADSEWAEHADEVARQFPGEITVIDRQRGVPSILATIAKEVQSRGDGMSGKESIYLVVQGMHRIKALREDGEDEDGHNAVELLKTILREGPEVGVHVLAWADTWGNITRGLDRKSIGEFGLRVATAMDSGDSMNFLDNLAASKISKAHRALLYDEDKPGQLLPFRPYAMPSIAWLNETGAQLRARTGNQTPSQPNHV